MTYPDGTRLRLRVTGRLDSDGDLDFGPDYIERGAFLSLTEQKAVAEVEATVEGWRLTFDGSLSVSADNLALDAFEILDVVEPVEPFKPGDVVRRKSDGAHWLIGEHAYRRLGLNQQGEPYGVFTFTGPVEGMFPTEDFERVSVEA
jgi:hypothetical protein